MKKMRMGLGAVLFVAMMGTGSVVASVPGPGKPCTAEEEGSLGIGTGNRVYQCSGGQWYIYAPCPTCPPY